MLGRRDRRVSRARVVSTLAAGVSLGKTLRFDRDRAQVSGSDPAVLLADDRCRSRWRAGVLVNLLAPPDGARCTLEAGHDGDHHFAPNHVL